MFQIVATTKATSTTAPATHPVRLTDPRHIRALAHPARLAVIEELYGGRELTATECAEIAGLSPSAMSYHLRSLERAGIVERVERAGDGRERPWRAAGTSLQVSSDSALGANAALSAVLLSRLADHLASWDARKADESRQWRDASVVASGQVYLRVEELAEFTGAISALLQKYESRSTDNHPDDTRRVRVSMFAFPGEEAASGDK